MNIEWNKVTWYSMTLAIIMFVVFPVATFFLGRWYERETTVVPIMIYR